MSVEAAGARPENGRDRVTGLKGRLGRQLQEARRLVLEIKGVERLRERLGGQQGAVGQGGCRESKGKRGNNGKTEANNCQWSNRRN